VVAGPLAEQLVQLVRVDQRVLVFYCETLIRELDLTQGSKEKTAARPPWKTHSVSHFPFLRLRRLTKIKKTKV
jgi:hypothetical protein